MALPLALLYKQIIPFAIIESMYIRADVRKLQPCTWKFSYWLCEKLICMLNIKPRKRFWNMTPYFKLNDWQPFLILNIELCLKKTNDIIYGYTFLIGSDLITQTYKKDVIESILVRSYTVYFTHFVDKETLFL